MHELSRLAMIPEHLNLGTQLGFIGNHCAGFSKSTQILAGVETKTTGDAQAAGSAALVFGTVGLAGILDDGCSVAASDSQNRVHIGHLPKNVDRNDCLSAQSDGGLQQRRIHRVSLLVNINKYRTRTAEANSFSCRHEAVWGSNYLITRANPQGEQA